MASLLNDLADELDAADNNTTEPDDPNNAVVYTDDSLVYVLTEGEDNINRDRSTLTIQRYLQDVVFKLYLILWRIGEEWEYYLFTGSFIAPGFAFLSYELSYLLNDFIYSNLYWKPYFLRPFIFVFLI